MVISPGYILVQHFTHYPFFDHDHHLFPSDQTVGHPLSPMVQAIIKQVFDVVLGHHAKLTPLPHHGLAQVP